MSKFKKTTALMLSVIMLVCMFSVPARAYDPFTPIVISDTNEVSRGEYKDFSYILYKDKTAMLTEYYGDSKTVTIPGKIKGYTVKKIDRLSGLDNVENLIISEGVECIDFIYSTQYDFSGRPIYRYERNDWNNVKTVTLPSTLTEIGYSAFYGCSNLTKIIIPENVTKIGDKAFSACSSLKSVTIKGNLKEIGKEAFKKCALHTIELPSSLETIGDNAFEDSDIEKIDIPKSVTSIGRYTFRYCSSLISVTLHNGLKQIGEHAFESCRALSKIRIPETVVYMDAVVFKSHSDNFTIYCCNDTTGRKYAIQHDIKYIIVPHTTKKLKATATSTSATLSWAKDEDAEGYIIEQYNGKKWVEIGKVKGYKNSSYTVKGLRSGMKYKFRVKGYLTYNKTELYGFTASTSVTTANS